MKTALLSPTPRVSKCVSAKEANWNETFHAFEFRFRRLFEAAPHGILLLNSASGEITDANPFAVDLLDYPFEELCGRELWEIGRYEDIAVSRASFKKLQETKHAQADQLALRKKDGEVIAVEIECTVYQEGGQEVAQCTIRPAADGQRADVAASLRVPAPRAQPAWLLAHSQRLRASLTEIAWMIGLMELEQGLVAQPRSPFDEAALRHVRRNLQTLIQAFNQLSALTGESVLWLASDLSPGPRTAPPPPPRVRRSAPLKLASLALADQPYHS